MTILRSSFIVLLLAALCLSAAPQASGQAFTNPLDDREDVFFKTFLKSCYAHAGDTEGLEEWADKNMKPREPNSTEAEIESFVGKWSTKYRNKTSHLRLIEHLWICELSASNLNGLRMLIQLDTMKEKLARHPTYKVITADRTELLPPGKHHSFVLIVDKPDHPLLVVTLNVGLKSSKSVSLSLSLLSDRHEYGTVRQYIDPTGDNPVALQAEIMENALAYLQYREDRNETTKQATALFTEGCVDNYGDEAAIREWAQENMPLEPDPEADFGTLALDEFEVTGSWAQQLNDESRIEMRLTSDPMQCLMSATNSYELLTHHEMKVLAGRTNRGDRHVASYMSHMSDPPKATHYSIVVMVPRDRTGISKYIMATTDPETGKTAYFSVGRPKDDKDELDSSDIPPSWIIEDISYTPPTR